MRIENSVYVKIFERLYLAYSYGKLSFEKLAVCIKLLNRYIVCIIALFMCLEASGASFGECSYYNTASCKREGTSGVWTASGEKFDDNGLTCAMRSRDFGKYYKVTNIANGKSVIVKHNDFGPNKKLWKRGRIIDLSEGAFRKIADVKVGIIQVKIE